MLLRSNSGPQQRMPIASSNGKSSTASRTSRKTPLSVKIGSTKRRKATNHSAAPCSLSMVVIYSVVASMFLYVLAVVLFTRTLSTKGRTATQGGINSNTGYQEEGGAPPRLLNSEGKKNPNYIPNVYSRDQWGDQKPPTTKVANVIKPQLLRKPSADHDAVDPKDREDINPEASIPKNRILTAYLEPIDRSSWKNKPLPTRTSTAEDLKMINFPQLNSCRKLPEQWPVDNYPEDDPFLPWIHDVFPSHDGTTIQSAQASSSNKIFSIFKKYLFESRQSAGIRRRFAPPDHRPAVVPRTHSSEPPITITKNLLMKAKAEILIAHKIQEKFYQKGIIL